jgi:hypothetical protein
MTPEPLPKAIYDKAKELGVTEIVFRFSGGDDEGYLDVELEGSNDEDFADSVKDWGWDTYGYNGAGDGTQYGDDIFYNIEKNTVTTREWYYTMEENFSSPKELTVAEEVKEE